MGIEDEWIAQDFQIEESFESRSIDEKIDLAFSYLESECYDYFQEDLQKTPDDIITYVDVDAFVQLHPEEAWKIIEASHLYSKILAAYSKEFKRRE